MRIAKLQCGTKPEITSNSGDEPWPFLLSQTPSASTHQTKHTRNCSVQYKEPFPQGRRHLQLWANFENDLVTSLDPKTFTLHSRKNELDSLPNPSRLASYTLVKRDTRSLYSIDSECHYGSVDHEFVLLRKLACLTLHLGNWHSTTGSLLKSTLLHVMNFKFPTPVNIYRDDATHGLMPVVVIKCCTDWVFVNPCPPNVGVCCELRSNSERQWPRNEHLNVRAPFVLVLVIGSASCSPPG